jgi:hypothetical protein
MTIMLCSKLHYQKVFESKLFCYRVGREEWRPAPSVLLYVLAGHSSHDVGPDSVYPGSHRQISTDLVSPFGSLVLWGGHTEHDPAGVGVWGLRFGVWDLGFGLRV